MGSYLGQNFLIDSSIRHFIADRIRKIYGDFCCEMLIEIGPGKGALTKLIKDISPQFVAIEKDTEMLPYHEDIKIVHCDILQVNLSEVVPNPSKTLIVGNLPYYITSPILRMFFGEGKQGYVGGVFMVQKEVAEKVKVDADKKSYLWWLLNYAYEVKSIKTVPAKAFSPAPKVTSAVIQLKRKEEELPQCAFGDLLLFLEDFSPYSRKTLGAIATMVKKKGGKDWKISDEMRGKRLEEVNWEEMERIINNG